MKNRFLSDIDAEQATIGACLISPDALTKTISLGLLPEDFSQHNHNCLWTAMVEMHSKQMKCDAITLGDQLAKSKKVDEAGGVVYAIELASNTPGSANVEAYADIVMECATARKVFLAGQKITALSEIGSDALVEANKIIQQIQPLRAETLTTISACTNEFVEDIFYRYEHGNVNRTKTDIILLDKILGGGLEPGLYVIAGRPSQGKTGAALQIAINISVHRKERGILFSLEMLRKKLMERAVANIARIPLDRIISPQPIFEGRTQIGGLLEEDLPKITHCVSQIKNSPLIISDGPRQSPKKIIAQAQRAHQKMPLKYIIIDHTMLMHFGNVRDEGAKRLAISDSLKEFVALYKELGIPVILLHQLNRANEARSDKRPIMSDLSGTGAIEQDADCIIFPHRDSYYESGGASSAGLAEFIIGKNRNGATGSIPLNWEPQYQNFGEWKGQWPLQKNQNEKKGSVYSNTVKGKSY